MQSPQTKPVSKWDLNLYLHSMNLNTLDHVKHQCLQEKGCLPFGPWLVDCFVDMM